MSKNKIIEKRKQVLRERNAETDFMSRNYTIYIIMMWVLYPLAALYSAMTEGGHLYSRFSETLNTPFMASVTTLFIVLMIEIGSIVMGKSCATDLVEGVFGEDVAFRQMFFAKLLIFFICFGFSCSLSITGGTETTAYVRKHTSPPTLLNEDSVKQVYAARVALQESTIVDARNMTWQGRITRNGQAIIKAARASIENIEAEQTAALLATTEENNARLTTWDTDTQETGAWATGISIIGQILMLFSLIIGAVYRSGENNLITNLETITQTDINQDGHIGKAPTPSAPTVDELATAVAEAIDAKKPPRTRVPFLGSQSKKPPKGGAKAPQMTHETTPHSQAETHESQWSQPETIILKETVSVDFTRDIKNCRNWYKRDDPRYTEVKAKLEKNGYEIEEISNTSLTIKKA